ncbi:tyrosine-type recombinase/integrase [Micromonospora sp. C31]|uniref:tyrosine-type recombinase/integrase n=1 Tax=Micromonospora sp. C31 TaxID=2824876 RepID=UPI0035B2FC85
MQHRIGALLRSAGSISDAHPLPLAGSTLCRLRWWTGSARLPRTRAPGPAWWTTGSGLVSTARCSAPGAASRLPRRASSPWCAGSPTSPDCRPPNQISPHSLRHAAATAALDDGAPLRDVKDLLGHADPAPPAGTTATAAASTALPAHRLAVLYGE